MAAIYIWVSAAVLGAMCLIWSRGGWFNVLLKLVFAGISIWGFYCAFLGLQ